MDCEKCGEKDIETERQEGCSCHVNPPCSACTDAPFVCRSCGEMFEIEHPILSAQTYKPMPMPKPRTLQDLDRTKIDWIHTGKGGRSFHDVHGFCPDGETRDGILRHMRLEGRPCLPMFKAFESGGFFHLSYFID